MRRPAPQQEVPVVWQAPRSGAPSHLRELRFRLPRREAQACSLACLGETDFEVLGIIWRAGEARPKTRGLTWHKCRNPCHERPMIELMFVGVEERNPHQWNAEFVCAAIDDIAGYHKNVLTVLDPALRGYVGDIHAARIHRQSGSCIERGALR